MGWKARAIMSERKEEGQADRRQHIPCSLRAVTRMVPLLSLELSAAGKAGISGAVAVALAAGAGAGAAFWVGEGAGAEAWKASRGAARGRRQGAANLGF